MEFVIGVALLVYLIGVCGVLFFVRNIGVGFYGMLMFSIEWPYALYLCIRHWRRRH